MLNALKKLVVRDRRAAIVKWARWGIANESRIHYSMTTTRDDWLHAAHPATLPLTTDCSGKFTFNYFMAGAPDPNGLAYKALGYTGTLMGHGRQISRTEVLPGDAVIWGAYPGVHVATALDRDAHTLESHGQESGPSQISFDAENAYHSARGHHATFWRFPTNAREQAAHVPAGYVQHPASKPIVTAAVVAKASAELKGGAGIKSKVSPKKATAKKSTAKKAPPKRRYYTRRANVKLAKGQTVGYVKGRGYYAKPVPKKR